MNFRFVTKTVHAYLDYPVALSLMITPFLLGIGRSNPVALWLSLATGVAALTGVIRVLSYWLHVAVDRIVGAVFVVALFVFGFEGLDALCDWANSAAVLLVTFVLNAPERAEPTLVPAKA